MRTLEPARDRLRLAAVEIHFGAIARRQDRGFLDHPLRRQLAQGIGKRIGRERHPLAHVERRGRVVESERVERHVFERDGHRPARVASPAGSYGDFTARPLAVGS